MDHLFICIHPVWGIQTLCVKFPDYSIYIDSLCDHSSNRRQNTKLLKIKTIKFHYICSFKICFDGVSKILVTGKFVQIPKKNFLFVSLRLLHLLIRRPLYNTTSEFYLLFIFDVVGPDLKDTCDVFAGTTMTTDGVRIESLGFEVVLSNLDGGSP